MQNPETWCKNLIPNLGQHVLTFSIYIVISVLLPPGLYSGF